MSEEKLKKSNAEFLRWFKPVLQALRDLGGSATPADAKKKIIENEHLTEDEVKVTRGKNHVNKFSNEVDFARSYLVNGGYIDNSVRGVWTLTETGKTVDMTDDLINTIYKHVNSGNSGKRKDISQTNALGDADVETTHYWLYAPGEDPRG